MRVCLPLRGDAEDQQSVRLYSQVLRGVVTQRTQEQARGHQQHQANGNLPGQHNAPAQNAATARCGAGSRGPQHARNRSAHRTPQGDQPKDQRGRRGDGQGKEKNAAIRAEAGLDLRPGGQQPRSRNREEPTERRSRRHQQQTFREQLAEDGALACADGQPQAELPLPRRVARLHHHGHVGAGDQQHQHDQAHENPHRLTIFLVVAGDASRGNKIQERFPLFGID